MVATELRVLKHECERCYHAFVIEAHVAPYLQVVWFSGMAKRPSCPRCGLEVIVSNGGESMRRRVPASYSLISRGQPVETRCPACGGEMRRRNRHDDGSPFLRCECYGCGHEIQEVWPDQQWPDVCEWVEQS